MSGDGIGYLDHDPFTSAQDGPERFSVLGARRSADSVLVDVDVFDDKNTGNGHEKQHVILALLAVGRDWRIADIVDEGHSLVKGLVEEAAILKKQAADSSLDASRHPAIDTSAHPPADTLGHAVPDTTHPTP